MGDEETEALLKEHNAEVPISLQTNILRVSRNELLYRLEAKGYNVEAHPCLASCIILRDSGAVSVIPGFREGHFYVQDCAAFMAVMAAEPKSGERVLDVCSAPGGKSFAAAVLGGEDVEIVSCDIHENKLKRIRESAQRLGIEGLSTRCADGRVFIPEFENSFGLVIADVPCSGLGVIRKKPDIRYKDQTQFDALPGVQLDILTNASRYVAEGGRIIYSTCFVRPEENEKIVEAFLDANDAFAAEDFTLPGVGSSEKGMLQLWPLF